MNPNDADLLAQTASAYADLGREADARRSIERALDLARDNVFVLLDAALVYRSLGDEVLARRWLQSAIEAGLSEEEVMADPQLKTILQPIEG